MGDIPALGLGRLPPGQFLSVSTEMMEAIYYFQTRFTKHDGI